MIIIWFIGIIVLIVVITVLLNIFKNWHTMMNYKNLFTFLSIGTVVLSVFFYFIEVDIWMKIIGYTLIVITSLFYGAFKKSK